MAPNLLFNTVSGGTRVARLSLLITILFFCGCNAFQSADSSSSESSSCVVDVKTNALVANYSIQEKCEIPTNYVCETNTANSTVAEKQCTIVDGWGEVCLIVDTSTRRTGPFHCSNTELTNSSGFMFQSIGNTLGEALSNTVAKCRARTL